MFKKIFKRKTFLQFNFLQTVFKLEIAHLKENCNRMEQQHHTETVFKIFCVSDFWGKGKSCFKNVLIKKLRSTVNLLYFLVYMITQFEKQKL